MRGEPYRPWLAIPSQVQHLNPWFDRCTHGLFSGYDPPRTLEPATAAMATPAPVVADTKAEKDGNTPQSPPAPGDLPMTETPKQTGRQ